MRTKHLKQLIVSLVLLMCVGLFGSFAGAAPAGKGTLKILSPNGGENLKIGATFQVKWSGESPQAKVILILYKKGIKHSVIAQRIPNNGKYMWRIPRNLKQGTDYRIRIRLMNNLSVNDFSDRDFTIK